MSLHEIDYRLNWMNFLFALNNLYLFRFNARASVLLRCCNVMTLTAVFPDDCISVNLFVIFICKHIFHDNQIGAKYAYPTKSMATF